MISRYSTCWGRTELRTSSRSNLLGSRMRCSSKARRDEEADPVQHDCQTAFKDHQSRATRTRDARANVPLRSAGAYPPGQGAVNAQRRSALVDTRHSGSSRARASSPARGRDRSRPLGAVRNAARPIRLSACYPSDRSHSSRSDVFSIVASSSCRQAADKHINRLTPIS